jgi:hypothetical protein
MKIHPEGLALAEDLLTSLHTANRLDGYFATQHGGAWGGIHEAVILTLTAAIVTPLPAMFWPDGRDIAKRLVHEALDNGENLAYQIELMEKGIIS